LGQGKQQWDAAANAFANTEEFETVTKGIFKLAADWGFSKNLAYKTFDTYAKFYKVHEDHFHFRIRQTINLNN
jgi:hypothetical protein